MGQSEIGFYTRVAFVAVVFLLGGIVLVIGVSATVSDGAPTAVSTDTDTGIESDAVFAHPSLSPSLPTASEPISPATPSPEYSAHSTSSFEADHDPGDVASPGDETLDPIEIEYNFTFEERAPLTADVEITFPEAYTERDGEFTLETSPSFFTCNREDGFLRSQWDGERSTAIATCYVDLPVENTRFDGYDFYATDEWAFAPLGIDPQYTEDGVAKDHLIEESSTPDAAVGDHYTFVGPHKTHAIEAAGQEIRLIVPKAAELSEDTDDILDSLAFEARNVRVETRKDEVDVFVTTSPIRGGGQARSGSVWVHDGSSLAWNTWGHEYIHTRQNHRSGSETKWLIEAEARYFQHLLSVVPIESADRQN